MGWRAETMHGQIGPNTVLSIFEEPWGPGLPVHPLPSGVSLAILFPNGAAAKIDVIEASATEAIIQTSNQAKWRMVQVAPKELRFPPASTADAPTSYWVVKDHIAEQLAANTLP